MHQSLQLIPSADAATLIQAIQSFLVNIGSFAISTRRDDLLTQLQLLRTTASHPGPDDLSNVFHGFGSLPHDTNPLVPPITFPPAPSLVNPVNPELAAILSIKSWEIPFPPSFTDLVQTHATSTLERHRSVQPTFPSIESARAQTAAILQSSPPQPTISPPMPSATLHPQSSSSMLVDPHYSGTSVPTQHNPPPQRFVGSPLHHVPVESQIQPSFRHVVTLPPSHPQAPTQHVTSATLPTITSHSLY